MHLSQLPAPTWPASTQSFSLPRSSEICREEADPRSEAPGALEAAVALQARGRTAREPDSASHVVSGQALPRLAA